MGKLDVTVLRYLTRKDFRVLAAVERGMTDHEVVPDAVVAAIAVLHHGGCRKNLSELMKHRLVAFEKGGRQFYGYRLTNSGHDYLALNYFAQKDIVASFGRQIGVGKESDVFVVSNPEGEDLCLKLHRLGRTSFRQIKNKRDYHKNRSYISWTHLSNLSASKEFLFLQALHEAGFSVPKPIAHNRHAVVMELIDAAPMWQIRELEDAGAVYSECMDFVVRLASHGLIHGDFNEFNIMVRDDGSIVVYDLPQAVSTSHPNAEWYFDRDVQCIRTYFHKRYAFEGEDFPVFKDIVRTESIDIKLEASGFTKNELSQLEEACSALRITEDGNDEEGEDFDDEEEDEDADNSEDSENEEADERKSDDKPQPLKSTTENRNPENSDESDDTDDDTDRSNLETVDGNSHKKAVERSQRLDDDRASGDGESDEESQSESGDGVRQSNARDKKSKKSKPVSSGAVSGLSRKEKMRMEVMKRVEREMKIRQKRENISHAYSRMIKPKKQKSAQADKRFATSYDD